MNDWDHIEIQCLPAKLHNTPDRIPGAVGDRIEQERRNYEQIFVAYADCGTGGLLDNALADMGIERIPGAHCYEFFAGSKVFHSLAEQEPGSFYLTDFLVQHFERLVIRSLGLDRQPQLMPFYFGNYKRVIYLAQTESAKLQALAKSHAEFLGLDYLFQFTGDRPLTLLLKPFVRTGVERLEAQFPNDVLEAAVKAGGVINKDKK
ncbi:DUF1638 domain-containing protein [Pseudomonadota bacterium]